MSLSFETKKINCFIYFAIVKHYWVVKIGEFKSDQKYFPDKSENPESLE